MNKYILFGLVIWLIGDLLIFAADDGFLVWTLASSGAVIEGTITGVNPNPQNSRSYSEFSYDWHGSKFSGHAIGALRRSVGQEIPVTIEPSNPAHYVVGNAQEDLHEMLVWAPIQSFAIATLITLAWRARRNKSIWVR
jgi:hypothetical protein